MGALLLALATFGCSGEPAHDEIVVCDGTGNSDACTADYLAAELARWARNDARYRPGASWRVVLVGADAASAAVAAVVTVPAKPPAGPHGWGDWAAAEGAGIAELPVAHDEKPGRNVVRSDEAAAIRLAARIAASDLAGRPVDLVLAMDGFQIGGRIDLDGGLRVSSRSGGRRGRETWGKPPLLVGDEAVASLAKAPLGWDLAGFASVTVCGFTVRADAARAAARDAFWAAAFVAGHAPPVAPPRTTCGVGGTASVAKADGGAR